MFPRLLNTISLLAPNCVNSLFERAFSSKFSEIMMVLRSFVFLIHRTVTSAGSSVFAQGSKEEASLANGFEFKANAPDSSIEVDKQIGIVEALIPQRSERKGIIIMVPLPSECRESKVRYPVPWGGKGGNAS